MYEEERLYYHKKRTPWRCPLTLQTFWFPTKKILRFSDRIFSQLSPLFPGKIPSYNPGSALETHLAGRLSPRDSVHSPALEIEERKQFCHISSSSPLVLLSVYRGSAEHKNFSPDLDLLRYFCHQEYLTSARDRQDSWDLAHSSCSNWLPDPGLAFAGALQRFVTKRIKKLPYSYYLMTGTMSRLSAENVTHLLDMYNTSSQS